MKYYVVIKTLNQLLQHFSQPTVKTYLTKEEAENNFGEECIHLIQQGFNQIYTHTDIENNFIEKHFSNRYFTIMLILDSEEKEYEEIK